MEKNWKHKRNAETLQGSITGGNQIASEREGNRQLFTFALLTMTSSNLVPTILSYSFHGCRVGEDTGKEVGLLRVFFFFQPFVKQTEIGNITETKPITAGSLRNNLYLDTFSHLPLLLPSS